jgi:hypothetical protein
VQLDRLLAQSPALKSAARGQAWLVEAGSAQAHVTRIALAQGRVTAVGRRLLQAPWPAQLQCLLDETPAEVGDESAMLWMGPPPEAVLPMVPTLSLAPPFHDAVPRRGGQGPDFLRPEQRPGLLAWAWLVTAALVLGLAGLEARAALALGVQVEALALPSTPNRPEPEVADINPAERELRQRMAYPWQAVFIASETPATGLRWQVLEHAAGGELRLQGLASDPAPVQRVASDLRRQPAWQQVLVSRLEAQPEGLSFEIVARPARATP